VKHKKNLDGSNVTDMFGYFIYEDIEEEEEWGRNLKSQSILNF
jgi:hypothetical protein